MKKQDFYNILEMFRTIQCKKSSLNILNNSFFLQKNHIFCTNTEQTIKIILNDDIIFNKIDNIIIYNNDILYNFIKNLENDKEIDFFIENDNLYFYDIENKSNKIKINYEFGDYPIPNILDNDYDNHYLFEIDNIFFEKFINASEFCCQEEHRFFLRGVNLEINSKLNEKILKLASSDAKRLFLDNYITENITKYIEKYTNSNIIIPALNNIPKLFNILKKYNQKWDFNYCNKYIIIETKLKDLYQISYISNIIEGTFPNYNHLLPICNPEFIIYIDKFRKTEIKKLLSYVNKNNNRILFEKFTAKIFNGENLIYESEFPEYISNEKLMLNSIFFKKMIEFFDYDCKIYIYGNKKPLVFEQRSFISDQKILLMPIKIEEKQPDSEPVQSDSDPEPEKQQKGIKEMKEEKQPEPEKIEKKQSGKPKKESKKNQKTYQLSEKQFAFFKNSIEIERNSIAENQKLKDENQKLKEKINFLNSELKNLRRKSA